MVAQEEKQEKKKDFEEDIVLLGARLLLYGQELACRFQQKRGLRDKGVAINISGKNPVLTLKPQLDMKEQLLLVQLGGHAQILRQHLLVNLLQEQPINLTKQ